MEARAASVELNAEWVLNRLKYISDTCSKPDDNGRMDSSGAARATELIGKHLGMFTDKIAMTVRTIDDFLSDTDEDDES